MRDLGILLDTKLTFKAHIDHIVSKARSLLGFVKRHSKDFKCAYVAKSLYCHLVRSVLEYGSIVWHPVFDVDSDRIESVQRQFLLFALRWNHPFQLPPYEARFSLLNMETLYDRRKLACCSFVHNYLTGAVKASMSFSFVEPRRSTRAAASRRLAFLPLTRSCYTENSPSRRCIKFFNKFFHCYVPGGSINSFKTRVKSELMELRRRNMTTYGFI